MIHLFCGEDSIRSRKAYTDHIEKCITEGFEAHHLRASEITDILRKSGEQSLFSQQILYVTEGLEKVPFRKSAKTKKDSFYDTVLQLAQSKEILLASWEEDRQARLCKLKDSTIIHESRLSDSIFTFFESIKPKNKVIFITKLRSLLETQEEMFVFIMLQRHIRALVQIMQSDAHSALPPWQKAKLMTQAQAWDSRSLLDFYAGLIKIEIGTKTSANPYGIQKSLEILACHYLA